MRVAHISDVHFGRIALPEIVDVLVAQINADVVDAVVVSGDLTQRARRKEYVAAANMLRSFHAPVLVIPGNHDVYAYWYPWQRLFDSVGRYQQFISQDLTPSILQKDLAILGINSAHGRTIKGGRVRSQEREAITAFFSQQSAASSFKILAIHHHLRRLQALWHHDVVGGANAAWQCVCEANINLVLCGHLHVAQVEAVEVAPGKTIVIASAGTATSDRGRRWDKGNNYYNLITIRDDSFEIDQRRYIPEKRHYVSTGSTMFKR